MDIKEVIINYGNCCTYVYKVKGYLSSSSMANKSELEGSPLAASLELLLN